MNKFYNKRRGIGNTRSTVSIGYVSVPNDVDRASFLAQCYRTNTISVVTENNEYINNVKVTKGLFNSIIFPTNKLEIGSCVILLTLKIHNKPIAVNVIPKNDEVNTQNERTFALESINAFTDVQLLLDSDKRALIFNNTTQAKRENSVIFTIKNILRKGLLSFIVDGLTLLDSDSVNILSNLIEIRHRKRTVNNITLDEENLKLDSDNIEIGQQNLQFTLKGENTHAQIAILTRKIIALENALKGSIAVPQDGGVSLKTTIVAGLNTETLNTTSDNILSDKVKIE